MKSFLGVVFFFGVLIYAMFEQTKEEPNPYILIAGLGIFLIGFYSFSQNDSIKFKNNDVLGIFI